MDSRTMEDDFSVQTFASDGQEQHPHNDLHFSGGFEPFENVDDSAGNEIQPHHVHSAAGKLFVGGIARETSNESFASYFKKYGELEDSVIMMDKNSGRSRGFGFVTFADPSIADTVLDLQHVIDGRVVEVKKTVPREDMSEWCVRRSNTTLTGVPKSKKIFVGGILPSLSEDEFKNYFSPYGIIVEQQIMFDHNTGRSRGFGFVTFENEESVEKVLSDGITHVLKGKQVEIKRAIPKNGNNSQTHHGGGVYDSKSYNNFNHGYDRHGFHSYGGYENFWGGGGYGGVAAAAAGFYGGYGYGYDYGASQMYNAGGYAGPVGYFNPMSFAGPHVYGEGYRNGGGGGGFDNSIGERRYHPYRK